MATQRSSAGRTVSVSHLKSAKTLVRTQEFGNLEALRIEELNTAPYQRALRMNKVSEIAGSWDMAVAGAILVNRRKNGKLYIINGQHRAAAAQINGESHVLAQVMDGLTEKEEAAMRVQANVVQVERALERFRAREVAEDPKVLNIIRIVEKVGGTIKYSDSDRVSILAVTTLELLYDRDGTGDLLYQTLSVINTAFGHLTSHTANTVSMRGVSYLIENTPGLDKQRMIDKMHMLTSDVLMQRMRAFRSALGGSTWVNYSRAIVEAYNERLAAKNKIEFPKMDSKYVVKRPKTGKVRGVAAKNKLEAELRKLEAEEDNGENNDQSSDASQ